jgi:hypothetical protein
MLALLRAVIAAMHKHLFTKYIYIPHIIITHKLTARGHRLPSLFRQHFPPKLENVNSTGTTVE